MIKFKVQKQKWFCQETVSLFNDAEWQNLLLRNGFNLSKKITYHGDGKKWINGKAMGYFK